MASTDPPEPVSETVTFLLDGFSSPILDHESTSLAHAHEARARIVSLDDPDVRLAAEALGDLQADFVSSQPLDAPTQDKKSQDAASSQITQSVGLARRLSMNAIPGSLGIPRRRSFTSTKDHSDLHMTAASASYESMSSASAGGPESPIDNVPPSPDHVLHIVLFKNFRPGFFRIPKGSAVDVEPGDVIIVEAERGVDAGLVAHMNVDRKTAKELRNWYESMHYNALMQTSEARLEAEIRDNEKWMHTNPEADGIDSRQKQQEEGKAESPSRSMARLSRSHGTLHIHQEVGYEAEACSRCKEIALQKRLRMEELDAEPRPKAMIRLANVQEMIQMQHGAEQEELALETCTKMVEEMGLRMQVLDAEYRMDFKRLTFYYYSGRNYIDFVSLVTGLYKELKTRICMLPVRPWLFDEPPVLGIAAQRELDQRANRGTRVRLDRGVEKLGGGSDQSHAEPTLDTDEESIVNTDRESLVGTNQPSIFSGEDGSSMTQSSRTGTDGSGGVQNRQQEEPVKSAPSFVSASTVEDEEIGADIESLFSDPFDIASNAPLNRSHIESSAISVLAEYFARNEELAPLHKELSRLTKRRFTDNYRRILSLYHAALLSEAGTEKEKMAVRLLRRRTNRARLAREIVEMVRGSDAKEDEDDGTERVGGSHVQKETVNAWLAKLPALATVDGPFEGSGDVKEEHARETRKDEDEEDDDDGDDESEWETPAEEDIGLAEFPEIKQIELFLRRPQAFRTLLSGLRLLRLPGHLREVVDTVPKAAIRVTSGNDTSMVNRAKVLMEEHTECCWDWWPLEDPLRDVGPGNKRVEWKLYGHRIQSEVSADAASLLVEILELGDEHPRRCHCCRPKAPTFTDKSTGKQAALQSLVSSAQESKAPDPPPRYKLFEDLPRKRKTAKNPDQQRAQISTYGPGASDTPAESRIADDAGTESRYLNPAMSLVTAPYGVRDLDERGFSSSLRRLRALFALQSLNIAAFLFAGASFAQFFGLLTAIGQLISLIPPYKSPRILSPGLEAPSLGIGLMLTGEVCKHLAEALVLITGNDMRDLGTVSRRWAQRLSPINLGPWATITLFRRPARLFSHPPRSLVWIFATLFIHLVWIYLLVFSRTVAISALLYEEIIEFFARTPRDGLPKQSAPDTPSSAARHYTPSDFSLSNPNVINFGAAHSMLQGGVPLGSGSYPLQTKGAAGVAAPPEEKTMTLRVLFAVQGWRWSLELEQILVPEGPYDSAFFRLLRAFHRMHRHALFDLFSPFRFLNCRFVKFERLDVNRVLSFGKHELPDDHGYSTYYEYKPRPPHVRPPLVDPAIFRILLSECGPSCAKKLLLPWHDCICLSPSSSYLSHIPKRRDAFALTDDNGERVAFGIEADYMLSLRYLAVYHLLAVVPAFAFWAYWLGCHAGDWQNASIPLLTVVSLITVFWIMVGKRAGLS